jgi:hypothetical protein
MLNNTREHLNRYDNQHEFERLAADLLNSLGWECVEPMAPLGGSDGGLDIKYKTSNNVDGIALVTLRKDIVKKFKSDLAGLPSGAGEISLFCNVDVTPCNKKKFEEWAKKKGFGLVVFDLERIRSMLDTSFTGLREKYLHIKVELKQHSMGDIRAKLLLSPVFNNAGHEEALCLLASAAKGHVFPNYAVVLIIEEHAVLKSNQYSLVVDDAYNDRHGRKIFGRIYKRVVSPFCGNPIWSGFDDNLMDSRDRIIIDYSAIWSELLIVSEIYIPDLDHPVINKILSSRGNGVCCYKYSHEETF